MPHSSAQFSEKAVNGGLGERGERWAELELLRRGYVVLERNYHSRWGEIDLIAAKDGVLALVEVKTRKSGAFAPAKAAVNRCKRQRLWLTAECYLAEHPAERRQPRFDVAEVYAPQGEQTSQPRIYYIENAFDDTGLEENRFGYSSF